MEAKISDDALSFGLGAVILQRVDNDWIPVAYVSQSLSETERRYAEIEEKALAITWACEKFAKYILGWSFQIETDHKPLVSLLSTNHFDNFPPRVLHFCLRMAKFNFHNPACPQETAMNSRHTAKSPTMEREGEVDPLQLYEEVEAFIASVTSALPAIKQRYFCFASHQTAVRGLSQRSSTGCSVCKAPRLLQEWMAKEAPTRASYWSTRGSITQHEDLLLYNGRIVVPAALQKETMAMPDTKVLSGAN